MGNSTSTHHPVEHHSSNTNSMHRGGDPFNSDMASSNVNSSQPSGQQDQQPVRVSVTAPSEGDSNGALGIDIPVDTSKDIYLGTNAKAVPVSTGRSGWVSSTGNSSPWYGSLSSSASSYQQAESVRGPYYRARGMSINRDSEVEEDSAQLPKVNPKSAPQPQKGVPTIITWSQGGHNVYVTGTFNGWKHKIKLVKSTHDFSAVVELPPGTHRLKFIVDDEWKCSNEMDTATDPDGNLVNYLQVLDENDMTEDEFADIRLDKEAGSRPDTPVEKYTSEIPPELLALAASLSAKEESGKDLKAAQDWERQHKQPPSLPPHLDKVLLNSQAVSEEDNSVLPEPNHVTLNHLYAASIKDNVIALSTTTRYRKKYVTTLYYQPVNPKN